MKVERELRMKVERELRMKEKGGSKDEGGRRK